MIEIIAKAASLVGEPYLHMLKSHELSGKSRERVFCYELYHQIRMLTKEDNKISLNEEIDKNLIWINWP